jgi:hypothetical protein
LELERTAGVEHITTKTKIIMVTIATITRMGDLTRIETMIRASHMAGIDKASIDCIVHPGDVGRFSGATRFI